MTIRLAGCRNIECQGLHPPGELFVTCEEENAIIGYQHSLSHGRTLDCVSARVGQFFTASSGSFTSATHSSS